MFTTNVTREGTEKEETRAQKALSLFTVVKFPNSVCDSATAGRNGTCYTASECTAKGGSSSGACASSFGVCCVFEGTCGTTVAENNTYFSSSGRTLGNACRYRVCKCSSDICQLRLDFETFILSEPVTATTGRFAGATLHTRGQCNTDVFGVTSPGYGSVPNICGTNTGYHMYVPASDACNDLVATYGSSSTATTSSLSIKVSQIECESSRLPPTGCLQYFTTETGTIESFNYQGPTPTHLANQDYASCVRQGRSQCAICYFSPAPTAFGLGRSPANGVAANCGPSAGIAGMIDHLIIAGGRCAPPTIATHIVADLYCGGAEFECAATSTGAYTTDPQNTVCTNIKPFKIIFKSDGAEDATANNEGNDAQTEGFSLSFFQASTCIEGEA